MLSEGNGDLLNYYIMIIMMFTQGDAPDWHGVRAHQPLHLLESGSRQALQTRRATLSVESFLENALLQHFYFLEYALYQTLFCTGRKRKVGDFSRMDSRLEDTRSEKTANGPTEGTTKRNKMVNGLKVPSPIATAAATGSTASMRDMNLLENIIDWQSVVKKYKAVVKNS